ncbi:hypothetical protein [Peribacillus sp. SCS-37]|uniref:hypothetical protein n=1 Tax=Paraperibacillus esterisolvens TaxID=3115296 RepID=UPI003905E96D
MSQTEVRRGLRIRCDEGLEPEIRRACLEFASWLRNEFEFPIRVVVYIKKDDQIKNTTTKELVSGTFFAPFDKKGEPYIRVAAGDYNRVLKAAGRDEALAVILGTIAHELGHYYQWVDGKDLNEEGAENNSEYLLDLYSQTRDHP